MSATLTDELGPPAGFPHCSRCPYQVNGPVQVCVACASSALDPVAEPHCPVCSQALTDTGQCLNRMCRTPHTIDKISAVATYSGDLAQKIKALKYDRKWGWAYIFGRLVTGYLEAHFDPDEVDLIVPNPTWAPDRDLDIAHTEVVLRAARFEDLYDRWPFAPDEALVATGQSVKTARRAASWAEKSAKATAMKATLALVNPALVEGQRILVYDDVCTTGLQLDAVACFLREHGARSVEGLVLARTPWGQPRSA